MTTNTTHGLAKVVAIVGPTGSGKTSLSIELAEEFNGEIICADSRTVYRGMDIATAKPTRREQKSVPHHLLDVAGPGETVTAAAYKQMANAALNDVVSRGRLPFMVGGSGLYIDSVLYDFQFPPPADAEARRVLDGMELEELGRLLESRDAATYETIDRKNRRRVVRAIETAGQEKSQSRHVRANTIILGLTMSKEVARERLSVRLQEMFDNGLVDEAMKIGNSYGWDHPAVSAIGYGALKGVFEDVKSIEEARDEILSSSLAYYKRQMTWFKRNPDITWLTSDDEARVILRSFLGSGV
jgi:tRNA dimethylallyltransferase